MNEMELPRRGPGRPPLNRGDDNDPRSEHLRRAEQRLAEILSTQSAEDSAKFSLDDEFHIPKEAIPEGWSYNWKTVSVYNKEDPQHMSEMLRAGWSPVPRTRHPNLMYTGYEGGNIIRKGLMLMERPKQLTERYEKRMAEKTRSDIRAKEMQMAGTSLGAVERLAGQNSRGVGPVEMPASI